MNQPLILPPQSHAALEGANFNRGWYLFFEAAQQYAASGAEIVRRGTSAARLLANPEFLADSTLWIETDTGLVYQWRSATLTWSFVAGTQVIDQTLSAASTTINGPSTGAIDLVVILRQDVTGGRAVVWGAAFSGASVSLGDAVASRIATFRFVLSGGKYVQVGQQTVDMTP